ncbi:MAG: RsmB/NOP family class I SAM-dependent RNA methyltransferase [Betaproteobacteria bacterium]|nr:RsmB/NOP family class I SAM-dependent RNA methyltransferase [Betaproteobacteria bacterium]
MRLTSYQLDAAAEALRAALGFGHPADAVLRRFFRAHPGLGARDRAFVAETVFDVLRRKRLLDFLVNDASPRQLVLACLTRFRGLSVRDLEPLLTREETAWAGRLKALHADEPPLAVQADLPDWVVASLERSLDDEDILALGRAMQQPAPLDLRVNTLAATREEVLAELAARGIAATPTPLSPLGIRLAGKPALERDALYLSGKIEVQDEGSQLLGFLVAPRRHDLVVDFCAGAGGKSLLLGALMRSHGRLYAFDVSVKRLNRLRVRLKRSGLSNLHPQLIANENDLKVKRLAGKIDRVLVDAPCSGLGTLRRNPDLKWRQSPRSVEELKLKQAAILNAAAGLVKPGGRLVYATCSMLPEENEDIVAGFLAGHAGFALAPANAVLAESRIALDTGEYLRLTPQRHGTDGFFAAVMQRET